MLGAGDSGSTVNAVSYDHFQRIAGIANNARAKYEGEVDCSTCGYHRGEPDYGRRFCQDRHRRSRGVHRAVVEKVARHVLQLPIIMMITLESRRDRLPSIFLSMHTDFSHLDKKLQLVQG
jgi:hypothetical protein